jgi:MerR family transcriptional regulator, copper efflux regulator
MGPRQQHPVPQLVLAQVERPRVVERAPDLDVERHGAGSYAVPNLDTPLVRLPAMAGDALTIHEAAETTGWSPRMLRYLERSGLVAPARSASGYRLYGAAELQRLRTLRELLERFELTPSEITFALRLERDAALRAAVEGWLAAEPRRPEHVDAADWLRWEQDKHERLLAAAAPSTS